MEAFWDIFNARAFCELFYSTIFKHGSYSTVRVRKIKPPFKGKIVVMPDKPWFWYWRSETGGKPWIITLKRNILLTHPYLSLCYSTRHFLC